MYINTVSEFDIRKALSHCERNPDEALDLVNKIVVRGNVADQKLLLEEIFPIISNSGYGWLIELLDHYTYDRTKLKALLFMKDKLLPYLDKNGMGKNPLLLLNDELDYEILKVIVPPSEIEEDFTLKDFRDDPETIFPEFELEARKISATEPLSFNEVLLIRLQSAAVFGIYAQFYRSLIKGLEEETEDHFNHLSTAARRVLGKKDLFGVVYAYINALQEMGELHLKRGNFSKAKEVAEDLKEIMNAENQFIDPTTKNNIARNAERLIEECESKQ